ncbi:hypothetical protein DER29_5577 [Micromonospora sp. M71_S20]|uniref:hypothetical protein n=1 Tax=Micromonospora sp. M71_S20 TaxID=592872 RepID=UPI000EAF0472|nr:hypothetical protein [Micromonospora sp. M71_S20]RLK12299.1 hypothetical protein DER29_5577 [Micromonospora sp. M71_S20]
MNELRWLLLALMLFLVALPALSAGTETDVPPLWWSGLALVTAAGLIPVALRYTPSGDDGED